MAHKDVRTEQLNIHDVFPGYPISYFSAPPYKKRTLSASTFRAYIHINFLIKGNPHPFYIRLKYVISHARQR